MRPRTDRQTDTQTRVTTIHFASSTTHAKCNECVRVTGLRSAVVDGSGVVAGLRSLHSAHFELVSGRRREVVEYDVLVPGDGRQRLAERLHGLVVDVVVARVLRRLVCARVGPLQPDGRRREHRAADTGRRHQRR